MHATCVDIGGWGVLIQGPPGSGKSDLALRLIDAPGGGLSGRQHSAVLVADDQTVLTLNAGELWARPPKAIEGLIELRGLGILKVPYRKQAVLRLIVTLTLGDAVPRLPYPHDLTTEILTVKLLNLRLDPQLASAPARVRAALDTLSVDEPFVISTTSY